MFAKILHANDGSAPAFTALALALELAQQNRSELHMVSVMEVDYLPEFVEEIREDTGRAARRFRGIFQRAHEMAERAHLKLHTHLLTGAPGPRCGQTRGRHRGRPVGHRRHRPFSPLRADDRESRGSHGPTCALSSTSGEITIADRTQSLAMRDPLGARFLGRGRSCGQGRRH
jgi:hypothetical protein